MQAFFQLMNKRLKHLKTLLGLILLIAAFTSCNDNMETISVTFVHELTGKPIAGIEVNMYEWQDTLGIYTKISKVKFISSAKSDSTGKASFVIDTKKDNLTFYFYALKQAEDSLCANSRYSMLTSYYSHVEVEWGDTKTIKLHPSLYVKINLANVKPEDTYELVCGNQIMYRKMDNTFSISSFYLEPGMTHTIDIYKLSGEDKTYVTTKNIYIKYPESFPKSEFVFTTEVRTSNIEIAL